MALVDGGAGTLCYALDCLRLALAASFVVLLGKIGIIAVTKGNPAEISTAASSEDQEEGGIIRVVVRVSSVHYDSVIACSFVISGSYLLQIVLQVATRIVQVDLPLALYALTGLATFSLVRWTQGIDRATRGRRFLSILRTTCAIVAIFEVAIVAVLFRLVVGKLSSGRLWDVIAELSITVMRLLTVVALLVLSSPLGERVAFVPLESAGEQRERSILAERSRAARDYGSSRTA